MNNRLTDQVRIPKTAEIVAGKIRRAIISGEIPPGDHLPSEAQLITRFEVSRPTIREAIRILEFEDLISVSRGARGGATVKSASTAFVARAMGVALQSRGVTLGDVYKARVIIEPPAARLAAKHRPAQAVAVLRAHVKVEYEALEKVATIPILTAEFHQLLVEQSGNETLSLVASALKGIAERHQALAHRSRTTISGDDARQRSRRGIRSQEKLVDMIEQGDGDAAEAHWRKHMEKSGEFYLDRLGETSVVDILDD